MKRITPLAAALASVVVLTAGCSSSGGATSDKTAGVSNGSQAGSPAQAGTTKLIVGAGPVIVLASVYEALEKNDFAANKLAVQTQLITSGAQAVPLLLNGQLQFTAADSVGALTAISKHVPIVIVAQGDTGPDNQATDPTGLQVLANGPIKTLADLSGKTIAVNALGGLAQIAAQAALDKAGVEASSVKFIEMPIPQQDAAVKDGRVAAAVHSEPYLAEGLDVGLKTLVAPIAYAMPGASQVVYIASTEYAKSHPDVVKRFVASVATANAALAKDPAEIRALAVKYAHVSSSVAASMRVPAFGSATPNKTSLSLLNSVMVKFKVISAPIDMGTAVYTP